MWGKSQKYNHAKASVCSGTCRYLCAKIYTSMDIYLDGDNVSEQSFCNYCLINADAVSKMKSYRRIN